MNQTDRPPRRMTREVPFSMHSLLPTRTLGALIAGVSIAIAVAGCSAGTGAAWTFEPAPPSTSAPAASAAASGSGGSAEPASPGASAGTSPAASGGASGSGGAAATTLNLVALNVAYDQATLAAPAGAGFAIAFDNQDSGIPHNVAIKDASGTEVFKGEIVTGPTKTTYNVPALAAGTYTFFCSVHPNMTGTLTIK